MCERHAAELFERAWEYSMDIARDIKPTRPD